MQTRTSKYRHSHTRLSCLLSSSIFLMAAHGFLLTAPILVSISPVLASVPLQPPPPWMLQIVYNQKQRKLLTQADIDKLKTEINKLYSNLKNTVTRLNTIAASQGLSFRFQAASPVVMIGTHPLEASIGDTIPLKLFVIDQATGNLIATYDLGSGTFDK